MKKFPSHPHLIWNLLHRIDEHIIFLMPFDELYARAIDVWTIFDLTITEKKVREDVLGEKGKLTMVIKDLEAGGHNIVKNKYVIRDTFQYLNENVDTNYWIFPMNTLTGVFSTALLGVSMIVYILLVYFQGKIDPNAQIMIFAAILGIMGASLSNLITQENFLYVRGRPFWRYLLHNLMARPMMGTFGATFVLWIEKSKWIFSINPIPEGAKAPANVQSAFININISKGALPYVLIVIAIVSGFAAEKLLRNMIDRVLKRLEEKAEKTKESKTTKAKETA